MDVYRCDLCGTPTDKEKLTFFKGLNLCPSCSLSYMKEMTDRKRGKGRAFFVILPVVIFLALILSLMIFLPKTLHLDSRTVETRIKRCQKDLIDIGVKIEEIIDRGKDKKDFSEILPEIEEVLRSVTKDPFSPNGENYRFRMEDDGRWLLYSIGPDRRDDGGMQLDQVTGRGDIVYMGG